MYLRRRQHARVKMKKELGACVKEWCCSKTGNLVLAEVQAKQRCKSLQGDSGTSWIDIDGVQLDRVWWFIRYGRWRARMNHWQRLIEDTGGRMSEGISPCGWKWPMEMATLRMQVRTEFLPKCYSLIVGNHLTSLLSGLLNENENVYGCCEE